MGWQFYLLTDRTISSGEDFRPYVAFLHSAILDLLSNGLRIGFAFVFFASWLFGSLIRPFVSSYWEGLIETRKPVFTTLFSLIGGLLAGAYVLSK